MNETFIAPAKQLSVALQAFHRALIRAEIGDDPALQNPYTQLFALIGDPRFAWMGAISQLIARIDHSVVEGELAEPDVLAGFHRDAAALLGEGDGDIDSQFRLRHLIALQNEPEVGLVTGRLRNALAAVGAAIGDDQ